MHKKAYLASCIFLLTILVCGCGQLNQNVSNTKSQPTGVTLRGTVYSYTIFNPPGDPVSNAVVTIDGPNSSMSALANSKGEYVFTGIPDGDYQVRVSSEGYALLSAFMGTTPIKSISLEASDKTVMTEDVEVFPYAIISNYSPAPKSIISNNQIFTIGFNMPMDTTSFNVILSAEGIRQNSIDGGGTVQLSTSWSSDKKTVTITPIGGLLSNEVYRLQLVQTVPLSPNGLPPFGSDGRSYDYFSYYISAMFGFDVVFFDNELLYYADFRTPSGGAPSAPSNLQVLVNDKLSNEADFYDCVWGSLPMPPQGHGIKFSWSPSTGNVTGYKIYVSDSSKINLPLINIFSAGTNTTSECFFITDIDSVLQAFNNMTQIPDPYATNNFPFENNPITFKVVAYNGDGESDGPTSTIKDMVGTKFFDLPNPPIYAIPNPIWWNGEPGFSSFVGPDNILLADPDADELYLFLDGPVDPSTIIPSSFAIKKDSVALNILSAKYISSWQYGAISIVKLKASTALNDSPGHNYQVTITNIKDLAGNSVKAGSGDVQIYSP